MKFSHNLFCLLFSILAVDIPKFMFLKFSVAWDRLKKNPICYIPMFFENYNKKNVASVSTLDAINISK